jgi:hypothetical protein
VQTIIGLDHSKHCCGYAGIEPHLTEQELAQYVDALILDKQDQLPEEIRAHVADCVQRKKNIIETLELIWATGTPFQATFAV